MVLLTSIRVSHPCGFVKHCGACRVYDGPVHSLATLQESPRRAKHSTLERFRPPHHRTPSTNGKVFNILDKRMSSGSTSSRNTGLTTLFPLIISIPRSSRACSHRRLDRLLVTSQFLKVRLDIFCPNRLPTLCKWLQKAFHFVLEMIVHHYTFCEEVSCFAYLEGTHDLPIALTRSTLFNAASPRSSKLPVPTLPLPFSSSSDNGGSYDSSSSNIWGCFRRLG